jgi:hypothetical protein
MKSLIVPFSLAITTALAACGDGQSSGKATGQGGAGGGAGGATGTLGTGGTTVSSDCAAQACLREVDRLLASCPAQGTCVLDQASTSGPFTYCFGNGLKLQSTLETTTGDGGTLLGATFATKYVAKMGDTVCYVRIISETISAGSGATSSIMQTPSGETVASGRFDAGGAGWVTCPGFQETQFRESCGVSDIALTSPFYYLGTSPPDCVSGPCDF